MNHSASISRALTVFLCHGSEDKPTVREMYFRLREDGVDPWLDELSILPGQDWDTEIRAAVRNSDAILVCLSPTSVGKSGYVQKEIRFALDVADEKPDGAIFIIPVKLVDCHIPERLRRWQWVSYFEEQGYAKIIKALRARATDCGLAIIPGEGSLDRISKPIADPLGRLVYRSGAIRELLQRFKSGVLLEQDIELLPPDIVVCVSREGLEEALATFESEARRAVEKQLVLRLIGIRLPYEEWLETKNQIHCFRNAEEEPQEQIFIQCMPVSSSNISSIGYDGERRILQVAFHSGAVYQYLGVPEHFHQALMNADSYGRFLDTHIKKAGFNYRRIK